MNYIIILILHYIADFVCQTNNQTIHKSHDKRLLYGHVAMYSFIVSLGASLFLHHNIILVFVQIFVLHLAVDYTFGKIMRNKQLFKYKDTYSFINYLGLNQLLNQIGLFYILS